MSTGNGETRGLGNEPGPPTAENNRTGEEDLLLSYAPAASGRSWWRMFLFRCGATAAVAPMIAMLVDAALVLVTRMTLFERIGIRMLSALLITMPAAIILLLIALFFRCGRIAVDLDNTLKPSDHRIFAYMALAVLSIPVGLICALWVF